MRVLAVSLFMVVFAFSGCLGQEESVEETGGDVDADGPGQEAGSVKASQVPPPAAPNASAAPVQPAQKAIHHEGMTPRGTCAFTIAGGACVSPHNAFVELDAQRPVSVRGQVTWEATTPATEQLLVYLIHDDGSGWVWEEGDPEEFAGSPLSFEWDLSQYEGEDLAIFVDNGTGACAVAACAFAFPGQEFVLDGTLFYGAPA